MQKTLSVSPMLRPIMSETHKTTKIILVLYLGLGYNSNHIRSIAQYSTKMIFAVLYVSLTMGLNIGETDKVFCIDYLQTHTHTQTISFASPTGHKYKPN